MARLRRSIPAPQAGWDLIVIGGGITGAGILRLAAARGLNALLLEQQDFAWGTSSRSSKMVHGGLRYLAQGDLSLTRDSLREREWLLREAPGLVERQAYYLLLDRRQWLPCWAVKMGLWLYDRLAGIRDHHPVSVAQLGQEFAGLDSARFKGAFYYTDAVTDDARLVQRLLQEAGDDGATAVNYARVESLRFDPQGQVCGVNVADTLAEGSAPAESVSLSARVVVNATGAWADRLRQSVTPETRVRPQRGSHLLLERTRFPLAAALTLNHPVDQRVMFCFPWEGRTVIGTTDLDHRADLDEEAAITADEVDYLLQAANTLFPRLQLGPRDVLSSWAGVRPIIGRDLSRGIERGKPSAERRHHAVWTDRGLITVSGGKLTSFRHIARQVLQAAAEHLPASANTSTESPLFAAADPVAPLGKDVESTLVQALRGRYGRRLPQMLAEAGEGELLSLQGTRFCLADCRWALTHEAVQHLDDLLLRRTRLGLLLSEGGVELLPQLAPLCQSLLGWDEQRWQWECERYREIWQRYYWLPSKAGCP